MKERLWSYTAGICKPQEIFVHAVGGVEDHIHLLLQFPATIAVPEAIKKIKANSSGWLADEIGKFAWQAGYGGFGVSKSNIPSVVKYIQNPGTASPEDDIRAGVCGFIEKTRN